MSAGGERVAFVAIGRNEGERLKRCLASLAPVSAQVVYVDSGSTDGSADYARNTGAEVVALDMSRPFTAARARNAGFERAAARWPGAAFVMFIDGDCEMAEGWIEKGLAFLDAEPGYAVACGRLRERHPEASFYNRMCDLEWATPVGEAAACGGIALYRKSAFEATGGFAESMIAGEEPELCLRLREAGWRIRRLDAEMARHDAAMTRFSQWWRRAVRSGHAYAEVVSMHFRSPKRIWVRETARALFWSLLAPAAFAAAVLIHPAALLLLLAYPLKFARSVLTHRAKGEKHALALGFFDLMGKFAETRGALNFCYNRLRGRKSGLLEYKN